jgi:signal transduction histidine kinase
MSAPSGAPVSSVPREPRGRIDRLGADLEGVLHSIGDGLIVQESSGTILWANDAAARILGAASTGDLVGSSIGNMHCQFSDESGGELRPDELPGCRSSRAEDAASSVVRIRDGVTGRVSWAAIRANLVPCRDDRAQLVATIWRDVTDERRRQEAARYLERATQELSQSIDYATTLARLARTLVPEFADWYSVDLVEGRRLEPVAVEHVNPSKVGIARELHNKYASSLDDPTGPGAVARTGQAELANGAAIERLKAAVTEPEDQEKLRQLALRSLIMVPLKTPERTIGLLKLMSSESGRVYDRLDLATAEELARRVAIAIENARAYREAREAIRLRDEFLVIAGHELRTPLFALKLQLEAVVRSRRRTSADDSSESARLEKAVSHSERMRELIDRMLEVSYIGSRRLVLRRRKADLAELWRQVMARYAAEAVRAGSAVSFVSTGRTGGEWDVDRLDEVLSNLLGNALKYGLGKPVHIMVEGNGERVRTTVRDEGMGIEPSAQPRLFDRFERRVSVRHYGGFGLGLWIARELVEAHGGTIGFDSQPGRGATFWVELPCAPSHHHEGTPTVTRGPRWEPASAVTRRRRVRARRAGS